MLCLGQVGDGVAESREMPKVSGYNKKEEGMKRFDPSLSWKDPLNQVNELLALLKARKGVVDQRDELNQGIQAKTAERHDG